MRMRTQIAFERACGDTSHMTGPFWDGRRDGVPFYNSPCSLLLSREGMFVCSFVWLSFCPSVHWSVHVSVHPSFHPRSFCVCGIFVLLSSHALRWVFHCNFWKTSWGYSKLPCLSSIPLCIRGHGLSQSLHPVGDDLVFEEFEFVTIKHGFPNFHLLYSICNLQADNSTGSRVRFLGFES